MRTATRLASGVILLASVTFIHAQDLPQRRLGERDLPSLPGMFDGVNKEIEQYQDAADEYTRRLNSYEFYKKIPTKPEVLEKLKHIEDEGGARIKIITDEGFYSKYYDKDGNWVVRQFTEEAKFLEMYREDLQKWWKRTNDWRLSAEDAKQAAEGLQTNNAELEAERQRLATVRGEIMEERREVTEEEKRLQNLKTRASNVVNADSFIGIRMVRGTATWENTRLNPDGSIEVWTRYVRVPPGKRWWRKTSDGMGIEFGSYDIVSQRFRVNGSRLTGGLWAGGLWAGGLYDYVPQEALRRVEDPALMKEYRDTKNSITDRREKLGAKLVRYNEDRKRYDAQGASYEQQQDKLRKHGSFDFKPYEPKTTIFFDESAEGQGP